MIEPYPVSPALLLKLDDLSEGITSLEVQVSAGEIDLHDDNYSFPGPLQVRLSIHRALEIFTVDGSVDFIVQGACCRCLTQGQQQLEAAVRLVLHRTQTTEEERQSVAEDMEFEFIDPGAREFDLANCLRETVLLELPMRIYCQKSCKGLCPICGQDLNHGPCTCHENEIDPRWEELKKIQFT